MLFEDFDKSSYVAGCYFLNKKCIFALKKNWKRRILEVQSVVLQNGYFEQNTLRLWTVLFRSTRNILTLNMVWICSFLIAHEREDKVLHSKYHTDEDRKFTGSTSLEKIHTFYIQVIVNRKIGHCVAELTSVHMRSLFAHGPNDISPGEHDWDSFDFCDHVVHYVDGLSGQFDH